MAFPTMNSNEFYNTIFNAYKLVTTLADQLSGLDDSLANEFRTDGGMYHDTLVYTDMDVLMSRVFDPDDTNVLAPEMVVAPKQQTVVIDKMRQIGLYTDNLLSKRAWMNENAFDQFESVVQAQVRNTKRVYDQRLVDCFVGTTETNVGKQTVSINVTTAVGDTTGEEKNRIEAQTLAKGIAGVFTQLKDSTRDYNDNEFLKAIDKSKMKIIWNADMYEKILYTDLPTIFHKDNLLESGKVLPARYFGTPTAAVPAGADGTTHRAYMEEYKIRVGSNGEYSAEGTIIKNVFPGDLLPKGTPIVAVSTAETTGSGSFTINGKKNTLTYYSTVHAYVADSTVVCKIYHENGVKFPSSFETSTEFWNPKNLRTNRYLTWIYANPFYLKGYPFITVKEA